MQSWLCFLEMFLINNRWKHTSSGYKEKVVCSFIFNIHRNQTAPGHKNSLQVRHGCLSSKRELVWRGPALFHHLVLHSLSRVRLLRPHGLWHTRLLCPWDFPGKNQFGSVQLLSRVRLFATPWTTAHQTSLSITNSQSLLKLMSIESVMPSNYLIFCRPLLLPPSIFPSIRVFSNESVLCIRWPKYWSGLPFPTPGDLRNPGIEPRSPALQADSLLTELWGKPSSCITWRGLKLTGQSSIFY